jgi:hypothetical protein
LSKAKLIIELVENGAIVTIKGHYDFAEGKASKKVYIFDEDNKQGLLDLLWEVDSFCMIDEGGYSRERVDMNLIHGSKYICKDVNCEICAKEREVD